MARLRPGVDRDRDLIYCQIPDAIVIRLYEVISDFY